MMVIISDGYGDREERPVCFNHQKRGFAWHNSFAVNEHILRSVARRGTRQVLFYQYCFLGCEATDIGRRCSQVTPATLAGHSGACISKICEQVCQDRRCPNPGVLESDQTNLSEIGGTVIVKAGPEALGISVTKVKSAPVAIWAVYGQKTWSFVSLGRHMALVEDAGQSVVW